MADLYVLIGTPASGKSTWVQSHPELVWVSRDEIRNEIAGLDRAESAGRKVNYFAKEDTVYRTFVLAIQKNLEEGKDVIADATHIDTKARAKLFRMLNSKGKLYDKAIAIVFNTPTQVCIERNRRRKGWRRVPDHVIEEMRTKFERDLHNLPDEGFDIVMDKEEEIYYVAGE